jgi:hypothetical protein
MKQRVTQRDRETESKGLISLCFFFRLDGAWVGTFTSKQRL